MDIIALIFLVAALVLFVIAAFVSVPRVNLIAAGLACLVLGAFILPRFAL